MAEERVIIAGAGPVGLVAAAHLVRHDIPVTVLEAGLDLSAESRASTFHPATLDMLA
jgi:3-(3-hydroxy-phenyl)propionate hydroxylase